MKASVPSASALILIALAPAWGISFTQHLVTATALRPNHVLAVDVDKDGDLDVVSQGNQNTASSYQTQEGWYENTGDGGFAAHDIRRLQISTPSSNIQALDFDGDGDVDFLITGPNSVIWWSNDGTQKFTGHSIPNSFDGSGVFAADLDKDGDVDLFGRTASAAALRLNDGAQSFSPVATGISIPGSFMVAIRDYDKDGDNDVAISAANAPFRMLVNDGSAQFSPRIIDSISGSLFLFTPVDLDKDGESDFVGTAGPTGGAIHWLRKTGDTTYADSILAGAVAPSYIQDFQVGDFDGDGDLDSIFTAGTEIDWCENDGAMGFTKHTAAVADSGKVFTHLTTADMDKDGDPDFVASVLQLNQVSWYENDARLRLSFPNAGDAMIAGETQNIRWHRYAGNAGRVKLEYSLDAGANWTLISAAVPNSGAYAWTIPPGISSAQARIRITDVDNHAGTADVSDGDFRMLLPSFTLTSPNGGEVWQAGTQHNVTWTTSGTIDSVRIEFSANGSAWTAVAASAPNTGLYKWTVPAGEVQSARIRVVDRADTAHADASDGPFYAGPFALQVTTPAPLDRITIGAVTNITWTTKGSVGKVKIEYSLNGGAAWNVIADSTANTGAYAWTAPNTPTLNGALRVSEGSDGIPSARSDSLFYIIDGRTFVAEFSPGWNLLSFIRHPDNPKAENIFSAPGLTLAKSGDGGVFWPAYGNLNTIGNVRTGMGYQVYASAAGAIPITGAILDPAGTLLDLSAGWNLIAFLPAFPIDAATALAGIGEDLTLAKNNAGDVFWPGGGVNSLGQMRPGQGYKLHMRKAAGLLYPSGVLEKTSAGRGRALAPEASRPSQRPTGDEATVLVPALEGPFGAGAGIPAGAAIGAYDALGNLRGTGAAAGGRAAFTVWGDDTRTAAKDGLAEGEAFRLELDLGGKEYPLVPADGAELRFHSDAIYVTALRAASLGIDPAAARLAEPNPYGIGFSLYLDPLLFAGGGVGLTILDLKGRIVNSFLLTREKSAPLFHWDGLDRNGKPSEAGAYLVKIHGRDFAKTLRAVKL